MSGNPRQASAPVISHGLAPERARQHQLAGSRQPSVETLVGGGAAAVKAVAQPGLGLEAVSLGGGEQTHAGPGALSSRLRAAEDPVLAAEGEGLACQVSCRLCHAANGCLSARICAVTAASRSGLSVTAPVGDQFRVGHDDHEGLSSRALV